MLLPAVGMAILSSFLATGLDGDMLKKAFGYFLIVLAVVGLAGKLIEYLKAKKKR